MSDEQPIEKTKAELFNESPDRFIDIQDCAIIIMRDKETKILYPRAGESRITYDETYVVAGKCEDELRGLRGMMIKQNQSKIVKPNGNFLQNLRHGIKK